MRDHPQMLSEAQAVTTVATSTSSYDQQAANKESGHGGKPLVAHVRVNAAFTGAASGVRIYLVDDSVAALTSPRVLALLASQNVSGGDTDDAAGVTPITDLDAIGDHLQAYLPPGIKTQQYLGIKYVPVNQALATGNFDAWVDDQPESAA